jgi:CRISPR-associated protein Csb2
VLFGIRYLTGYSGAFDMAAQQPEWPPHPARVFMALAASYFETGEDPDERAALEWLERQPAPTLRASEASIRSAFDVFVPVNDTAAGIVNRPRQPRQFPKCRPDTDVVYLEWGSGESVEIRAALAGLCGKVTRIGHSSSLVYMWIANTVSDESLALWQPTSFGGEARLRVVEEGFLQYLERQFNGAELQDYCRLEEELSSTAGKAKTQARAALQARFPYGAPQSNRPVARAWQGYTVGCGVARTEDEHVNSGPFDEAIIVLRKVEGANRGLESTLQLTGALRNAVMKHGPQPPPEWVSGHTPDGRPSQEPHLAFFPLPFVGRQYADGHIMGLAIAVPRYLTDTDAADRTEHLRRHLGPLFFDVSTGKPRSIVIGERNQWQWELRRENAENTLDPETWARAFRRWASVTPVVLHHHPKRGFDDVERILTEAFHSAGFADIESVRFGPVSRFPGAGHVKEFPPYDEGGAGKCKYQVHAEVVFRRPVRGPLLVGRGRFRGYGLFRPLFGEGRA